ncbi:MAG: 23S rRNA (adenine(2503)-C(2))-methyltransferase RlmN [Limnochordia bacterium]|jgi:23S rRNA (adenine2503-C2)-methyltransferase
MEKINLVGADLAALQELLKGLDEPPFRGKQIMQWLYGKGQLQIEGMHNLPKDLRQRLAQVSCIRIPQVIKRRVSKDGTRKYLLQLADGERIETVFIPEGDRFTLCVSSQVGCAMGCSFCATGQGGFVRNLGVDELVGQVLAVQRDVKERITNIVLMGMGEPLANYEQVMGAIRLWNHPLGFNIAARRLTISTCGLVPQIRQLAAEDLQIVLAISLHAPTDELRNQLMPINRRYPLGELISACRDYVAQTNRRLTFEYAMIKGVNDSPSMARRLGQLLQGLLCHINLIPLNPTTSDFEQTGPQELRQFQEILASYNLEATIRRERGADIEAACGQLRTHHQGKGIRRI